jgi:hypothetical protein
MEILVIARMGGIKCDKKEKATPFQVLLVLLELV